MQLIQQKLKIVLACATLVCSSTGSLTAISQETSIKDKDRIEETSPKSKTPEQKSAKISQPPLFVSDSNTGYIDNAIIKTRFQIRFDSGSEMTAPDRAEFFYGACGCARDVPLPPQNTPRIDGAVLNPNAPGPSGVVIPGAILSSKLIETSLDYQDLRLDYEYAFNKRFSVFTEIPIRFVDGEVIGSHEGIGDIRAGIKWGLLNNPAHQLTFQLRGYFPSGEAEDGLGTDHTSIEPGLTYFGRLDEHWTAAAELRYWHPLNSTSGRSTGFDEDYAGDIVRYGLGLGYDFMYSDTIRVTPVLEVVSWIVLGGLTIESPSGTPMTASYKETDGTTITNLKFGLRINVTQDRSVYIGYGKALTDKDWYDDIIRAEFRVSF